MNEQVKSLEKKERLTDEEISFLKSVQKEGEGKVASMMEENKKKLTSLIWSTLGCFWKISWEGRPSQCAVISLGEDDPLFGDFRIEHSWKGILTLKVGSWEAADPETDLTFKAKAEALQTIIGNWGEIKEIFAEEAFRASEGEIQSCSWQINSELSARKKEAKAKAEALARAEVKAGFAFRVPGEMSSRYSVEKVCPKTALCSRETLRGGRWESYSSKSFKLEELASLLAEGSYEAC